MRHPSRHFFIFSIAVLVGLSSLGAGLAGPAAADPISDKRDEARQLGEQIASANEEITALGERLNGAQIALDEAEAGLAAVQTQIDATRAEVARLRGLVRERAARVYRQIVGGGGSLSTLDAGDAQELLRTQQYAALQAERDHAVLEQLAEARDRLAAQRAAAQQARDEAAAVRQRIESTQADLETANAQQQQLLDQVQGEIAQLIQEEMARLQAQALAMARARYATNPNAYPNLPAPGPSTVKAIAFAKEQIGKTYVYAADGPDHYDCSGLVMAAFRSAGVSLPHYSGAQYDLLPHVPLDGMRPGDLIFWGSGGSSHVAIYLGDAQIIESGGSSHDAHIGPIWGRPTGAARVTA